MSREEADGRVERPWGWYAVVHRGDGCQVKILHVNPGAELSLQVHRRRSERWVVLSGHATAQVGDEKLDLAPGHEVRIPVEAKHRIGNPGDEPVEVVETQFGDYLGEDDIVRLEDRYGRV